MLKNRAALSTLFVGLVGLSMMAIAVRAELSPRAGTPSRARARVIAKTGALTQAVHLRILTNPEYARLTLAVRHEMAISSLRMLEVPIDAAVPFDSRADAADYAAVIVGPIGEDRLAAFEKQIDHLIESFVERDLLARALEEISEGAPLPDGHARAPARRD